MERRLPARERVVDALGEVFRERGFEGASLSQITRATGLGKGSLYHFFPAGKIAMANAVLDEIDAWFESKVFAPLASGDPAAVETMFDAVSDYFASGRRICLVGAFALNDGRDMFNLRISAYFQRWIATLAVALARRGHGRKKAWARAQEIVAGIQGAIVLARALDDPRAFDRLISRLRKRAWPANAGLAGHKRLA